MFRPSSASIVGAGVRAVGARGSTGPSEQPAWGPRVSLGLGGAIDSFGAWDALTTATVLTDPLLGTTNLARSEGGVDLAARPSIFVLRLRLREVLTAADAGELAALDAIGSGRVELAVPFARAYPTDEAPLVHVIEPRVQGSLVAAKTSGAYWSATGRPVALTNGEVAIGSGGIRTAWGRLLGHSGGVVEADAGGVVPLSDAVWNDPSSPFPPVPLASAGHPATVARLRTSWSSRFIGWGAEAASHLRAPRGRLLVGKARLGEQDGWHLVAKAAGRVGIEPLVARALASATAEEPSGGWLAAEGWTAGAEIAAKFTRSVGATLSAQEDLTQKTLLDVHGSIGYAHPCRCISIDAFGGKRLGREGIDVWVSIDLAPR